MTKLEKIGIVLSLVVLVFSFIYDPEILKLVEHARRAGVDTIMLFMTDVGLALLTSALGAYLLVTRRYGLFALVVCAALLSIETTYLLKKTFQVPRPYDTVLGANPLTYATGYAFPSLHAAFCLSLIPFVRKIVGKRWVQILVAAFLLLIAVSRTYLGVHYLSDVVLGSIIGYIFGRTIVRMEEKYQIYEWFLYHLRDKIELRRQVAHFLTGMAIVLGIKYKILSAPVLLGVLLAGGVLSLIARKHELPILHDLLRYFERPHQMKHFPGKGSFFLVLGSLLSVVLFEEKIALAAITIMAVGDAITTVIGTYFGKIKMPLNPAKHLEGTLLAIMISTLGAYTFVDFEKAFMAGSAGMVFELLTFRYIDRVLDDNVLIPLVAGAVMTVLA